MGIQKPLRKVHLWLGLLFGVFIVMMGLTGLVSVFRSPLESSLAPRASGAGPMRLDAVEHSFAASHPEARISRVTFGMSVGEPLLVQAETPSRTRLDLFIDPASGQDLGAKKTLAWLDWLVDLHQNLLAGKTGRAVTGVFGFALLLIGCTGLLSWWAGRRDWTKALAIPQKGPWRRVNYEGHRWAGLWSNLLVLVVSFTGVMLAYPNTIESIVGGVLGESQESRADAVQQNSAQHMDTGRVVLRSLVEYSAAAQAAIPGGVLRELRLPGKGRAVVTATLWTPADIRPKGGNTVVLDAATAQVDSVDRMTEAPLSKRFVEWANAIHKTELGGLPVKSAWSLIGLVPLILFFSGLQIWRHQRQPGSPRNRRAELALRK